jgi:hypothetical protein
MTMKQVSDVVKTFFEESSEEVIRLSVTFLPTSLVTSLWLPIRMAVSRW